MNISKVSSISLYVMLAITVVVLGVFYGGGYIDPNAEYPEPVYTNILIYWGYALVIMGVAVTAIFAIWQFVTTLIQQPKEGLKTIGWIGSFGLLMLVCWILGSDEILNIPGYEGAENVPFWLKITDMLLYSVYALIGFTVLVMLGSGVMKLFNR